ncbi:hypothetical protein [Tenacibaculum sp. 1B UA]|uniref:hypothetical protein n=1 Tax=Tenacibaculum sp. 1B UA TaxID=2922252 RepID=UPI002A242AD8|nr:hypothetical protein [Tenacibaculum sp. 1B UA]
MKPYLLFFIFFTFYSCEVKSQDLCTTLNTLYQKDQKYRGSKEMEDPFFRVFDSIRKKEGITREMYMKYTKEEQLEYGKKIRKIVNLMKITNQEVQDSLMDLQIELDKENTKKLLEIVKKNGFPDIKKLNCSSYSAPFSIFLHSPEEYWEEIKEVINKEKKNNRITKGDYDYIMWHVNGRKGSPILK